MSFIFCGVGGVTGNEGGVAETAVLGKEKLDERDAVAELQLVALHIVLTELHLEQVVAQGDACLQSDIDILGNIIQQSLDSLNGLHLLLQRNKLPEILLRGLLDFILRELELQAAHLLAHPCELIAVDDLSSSKDGLYGIDTSDSTILHHRDTDRVGEVCQYGSWQLLCHDLT